jgi:predicted HicB family RNase H-like nuclease
LIKYTFNQNVFTSRPIKNVSLYFDFLTVLNFRTLQTFKGKTIGAKKGYDLLKKKSDALKKAFNEIMKKIVQTKKRMGKDFKEC